MSEHGAALRIDIYRTSSVLVLCGKRRLERALKQLSSTVSTALLWRPFQLNPTMPMEGWTNGLSGRSSGSGYIQEMEQRCWAGAIEQSHLPLKIVRRRTPFRLTG